MTLPELLKEFEEKFRYETVGFDRTGDEISFDSRRIYEEIKSFIKKAYREGREERLEEVKGNSWIYADSKGIEIHAESGKLKKVLEVIFERIEGGTDYLWDWVEWRVIPDKLKEFLDLPEKCITYIDKHNFDNRKCSDCGLEIDEKTEAAILEKLKQLSKEEGLGVHGHNCPHCLGKDCECMCKKCRSVSKEENAE